MATEVVMPQMGYDMQEGTVVRWLKKEGEEVRRGEPIAEIETDKAVVEMEAYASGLLRRIVAKEGQTVPVGQVIGYIGAADEALPDAPAEASPAAAEEKAALSEAEVRPPREVAEVPPSEGMRVSPVARRLADEKGIDVRQVKGTGPGGRITKDDVLAYEAIAQEAVPAMAPAVEAAPAPDVALPERIDLSRMRQAIARRTQQSKREAPHFYVSAEIDMTRCMELRQQLNDALEGDVRISVNDLIVKACAKALLKFPAYNSFYKEDHLQVNPSVNIGIAIALEQGLIVPALLHCEQKSVTQIARESKELVQRAQQGHLRQDEYTAGTFSVSNLGMFDVDEFIAIIFPPQSAVLAVGAVRPRPVVREDQVVIRQTMKATISVDHRVSDGAEAARFLGEIKHLLENPAAILV